MKLLEKQPLLELHNQYGLHFFDDPAADISAQYIKERDALASEEQIAPFIKRWRFLFGLEELDQPLHGVSNESLERLDPAQVFGHLVRIQNKEEYTDPENVQWCIATDLMAPASLLRTHMAATKYGAPYNIVFFQLYSPKEFQENYL